MTTYTVAVRALCEFAAKHGDLDLRSTPWPTSQQGIAGHQTVAASRSSTYCSEVSLSAEYKHLFVRGRADGFDPERQLPEEVKTFKGDLDLMPANHRRRLAGKFGSRYDYSSLFPGIRKGVQTAGRVIRTVSDSGKVHLIDYRFARPKVLRLLPTGWAIEEGAGGATGSQLKKSVTTRGRRCPSEPQTQRSEASPRPNSAKSGGCWMRGVVSPKLLGNSTPHRLRNP